MKTVDQISRGVAHFYDTEVRPSLNGTRGILYGMAVGMAARNAGALVAQYMPTLKIIGVADEAGQIDVDTLADELKKQIRKCGQPFSLEVGKDVFRFGEADVDKIASIINQM